MFPAYAKKEVPSLDDKVLQLKHVGKEKKKCLETGGIKTVGGFSSSLQHESTKISNGKFDIICHLFQLYDYKCTIRKLIKRLYDYKCTIRKLIKRPNY